MVAQDKIVMAELTGKAKRAAGGVMHMSMDEVFVMREGKLAEHRAWVVVLGTRAEITSPFERRRIHADRVAPRLHSKSMRTRRALPARTPRRPKGEVISARALKEDDYNSKQYIARL
jgi:hypothetical protein